MTSAGLRATALIGAAVGAVGSVSLVLYTGQRNPSVVLMLLFAIWVAAPFAAFGRVSTVAKHWPAVAQTMLYGTALILTVVSLFVYGYVAFGPPRAQAAAPFLVVPPVSFALAAIVVWIASAISGKSRR